MIATMTLFSVLAFAALASAKWIVPGARWYDTDGNLFNAHAGGLCVDRESGKFYWFGEHKTEEQEEGGGISVYSSDDLATWESHGLALSLSPKLTLGIVTDVLQSLRKVTSLFRQRVSSNDPRCSTAKKQENTTYVLPLSSNHQADFVSLDVVARRRPQLQPFAPRPRNIRQHRRPLQIPTRRLPPR